MSTPTNQVPNAADQSNPLLTEVLQLRQALKATMSRLMAHSQVVQELLNANLALRAEYHMTQNSQPLEANVQAVVAPPVEAPAATDESVNEAPANADPVSP